ncbi:MAG: hypothetical protein QOJ79_1600 [Actinomycetota bacterium]|nr:hypothetical protein [Actinomycetota bacterium]
MLKDFSPTERREPWVDVTVDAEYFSCAECRLVLESYELLEQAGLETEFGAIGDVSEFTDPGDFGNE